jgi:outer membrane receptor protein involved in Fe transport
MISLARRMVAGLAVLAVLALPRVVMAQTEMGRLSGTVTDQTGGLLPGATVKVRNLGTQATRVAVTDPRGAYSFSSLPPGSYELTVEMVGFGVKQYQTAVTVGGSSTLNAKLELGQQTDVITVLAAEGLEVNTTTQDIATVVTEEQIRELPTITRNPYDLVALSGHVARTQAVNDAAVTDRGAGFAINGMRASSTNILLDGSANNDEFDATVGQEIPLDAVQEFSVITSNFSAQYGRASGGIVNVATKSGSNDFRGTVYDFFRNDALAANSFENKANEIEKAKYSRHQAGFSLGGPVLKDRVHFFTSLEYIRARSTDTMITWVPTAEFLAAAAPGTRNYFSQFPLATPINGPTITRAEVTQSLGLTGTGAFNSLPAGLPVFGQVQQPIPIDAGAGEPQNTYQAVGRLDFNLSNTMSAYVRYAYERETWLDGTNSQSPYAGFQSGFLARNHNILGSLTRIWKPTLTTQTKLVYNRLAEEQPLGEAPPSPGLYMNPTTVVRLQGQRIGFPGYLPFNPGSAIPFGGPQALTTLLQDVTWAQGKHDIRFGGSFVRIKDDRTFGAFQNAVMALNTASAAGPSLDGLVLGQIRRFQVAIDPNGFPGETYVTPVGFPRFTDNNRYNEWALYVNDSWSVTRRLKLNLGLRYEYYGVQRDDDGIPTANFYYRDEDASVNTSGADIFNQVRGGRVFRGPESPIGGLWRPDKNNFAPRLGFAYDVNGDGKMSVRGGYGIGFERNFGNVTFNALFNPPDYLVASVDAPADIASLAIQSNNQGPFGGVAGITKTIPAGSLRHIDQNIETAYAHFYSLSLERQIRGNTLVRLEYTGSTGRKLYDLADVNITGAGHVYLGDANTNARPNPQYAAFNTRGNRGRSQYHGVTAGVDMRNLADSGLSLTARYTLSSAKDNLSTTFSEGEGAFNLGYLDPLDPDLDYGYADHDARHRIVLSGIWELPLFKNATGVTKTALGGWQMAWLFTSQSGWPFSVFDCSNGATRCMRALDVPGGSFDAKKGTATDNPNEFDLLDLGPFAAAKGTYAHPTQGTSDFGPFPSNMTKRNAFRGPGRYFLDVSLSKRFRFGDRRAFQFRLEAYNILNHANLYALPGTADVSSATFVGGSRGDSVADNRRVQLGVKFEF